MAEENWGIHWFRRDLRIPCNEALRENWKRSRGRTLGLFCFDSAFLARPDFSHNRFGFFLKTLAALREDWRRHGGDLLVVDCQPHEAFSRLLAYCDTKRIPPPSLVSWNRDYEPFARERDSGIEELLKKNGVPVFYSRDHLLFEPHEITKSQKPGDFYQVYSPYAKKWFQALHGTEGKERVLRQSSAAAYFADHAGKPDLFRMRWRDLRLDSDFPFIDALEKFRQENERHVTVPLPEAGFHAAYRQLRAFAPALPRYHEQRDIPAVQGTSRLSLFLKNGSLTAPQVLNELRLEAVEWEGQAGRAQFTRELAWREFYYSILFHRPEVERESFLPQYRAIRWENDEERLRRWQEGNTGFPIVDAGMRELRETGWMHNRMRMITASFLTKDLLIDWRQGERWFMQQLLDGDLAPNNGGWQWAASTGCDPQPYFRVFNPWLQGKKFDPDGSYIRRFVPELREAPTPALHDPDADRTRWRYPAPIVEHSVQREKAIRLYKA